MKEIYIYYCEKLTFGTIAVLTYVRFKCFSIIVNAFKINLNFNKSDMLTSTA